MQISILDLPLLLRETARDQRILLSAVFTPFIFKAPALFKW